jgi:hypothetical protein
VEIALTLLGLAVALGGLLVALDSRTDDLLTAIRTDTLDTTRLLLEIRDLLTDIRDNLD